ncbi:MAG: hypothetical protein AAF800_04465 [Planctomycetota bacterium]
MAVHVAILRAPYVAAILAGTKTVESRLTTTRRPPLDCLAVGERLYFKVSSGPFRATATVARVDQYADLDPRAVDALAKRYEPRVGGEPAYWRAKRGSSFAVFVHLADVEPIDVGPRYAVQHMRAWYVLDDAADPMREVTLTGGALRNHYVMLPNASPAMRRATLRLLLPDGRVVETGFYNDGPRLTWRGWGPYFDEHNLQPGDAVRLVALGGRRYRVTFVRRT